MKQSTKLLSLILALLMAFSCMSVIGSAALVKSEIAYDTIDDADLSYEQVSDIALDLVDELLADADIGELFNILGLSIDLTSVDTTFDSLYSTGTSTLFSIVSGLLGDLGDLDFSKLGNGDRGYQRSDGDYVVISALLDFIGCSDNASILSKAAYGIGTDNGISLGSIIGGMLDLGSIQDMLSDIPGFLVNTVFDMLVYGSYGYDMDTEEIVDVNKSTLTATYPEMDTLDEIIPNAIYNLLTKPQDYKWTDEDGDGEAETKTWDMDSVIMPDLTLSASDINPLSNSLFGLLDKVAQIAIDEIAIPALNNNLKKALMLAVEADLNEIDYETLPAEVKTAFDNTDEYVTYFAYDKMMKSGGVWYYTTRESEVSLDPTTGEPLLDEEGNEISEKVRKYFKVNMGAANEFASLVNWDWEFVTSDVTASDGQTALLYDDIKAVNGSLVGGINYLLGMVYDVALTDAAKADFVASVQEYIDDSYDGWYTDHDDPYDNANINMNIEYLAKYILSEFGDKVFGEDSVYASYTMEELSALSVLDMVTLIGPSFFESAMPQIILPKNEDGTYAFHEGVQVWEFAVLVIRELMTGIAPIVNYDHLIFANGDVTSADDRLFVDYEAQLGDLDSAVDAWFNILLNMGLDLASVYLQQITNIEDYLDATLGDGSYKSFDLDAWFNTGDTTSSHWETTLNAIILWALDYIGGERSTGVLDGITYEYIEATYSNPLDRISYIFNRLLPLGFIGDGTYTSTGNANEAGFEFDLDARYLVDGVKNLLTNFDLTAILSLFGRNEASSYNMFDDASIGTAVLDLVNDILTLVFGNTLLQNVNATGTVSAQSVDNVISQASLKTTIYNLLTGLNTRKDYILKNAAPVLGKLIKSWGGEQEFNTPSHDMGTFVVVQSNGSTYVEGSEELGSGNNKYDSPTLTASPISFNFVNNSEGVWRHYRDASGNEYQDEQYQIQIVSVEAFDFDGSSSDYVSAPTIVTTGKIGFGQSGQVTFNVGSATHTIDSYTTSAGDKTAVPEKGAAVKFKIGYKVYLEDGSTALLDGQVFYNESFVWLSKYAEDARYHYKSTSDCYEVHAYSPTYVPYYEDDLQATLDYVQGMSFGSFARNYKFLAGSDADYYIKATSVVDNDGFTLGPATANCTENADLESIDIRLFDTYSGDWYEIDTTNDCGDYSVTGSVPSVDTFASEVPLSEVDSEAGATSSWVIDIQAKSNTDTDIPFVLKYYNATYRDKLIDLVSQENDAQRQADEYKHYYNSSATVVLSTALVNEDVSADASESGEFELRETNFGTNADGYTEINCATAWSNYTTALENALRGALQEFNPQSVYNFKELYYALRVAVNDIEHCYATAEDGAATFDSEVEALEDALRASEARTTDIYNHTDYKMYRHNKYNSARSDVKYYINLMKDAQPSIDEIDQYFDYSWMEENDFLSLIGAHTVKYGEKANTTVAQNEYYDYLVALLKDFSEEEIADKTTWLNAKKIEYSKLNELDLAMSENILTITEDRLLRRACGVIYDQLNDEIASAKNMIGTTNGANGTTYTDDSWANYIEAYNNAVDAQDCGSQKQVFDAKYNLLVERKDLVAVEDAADYAELDALIAHAEFALANASLYESKIEGMTINQILGMVLAELGMDEITSVDGYDVQLFPGSAYIVKAEAYGIADQDKIDDAAYALKEALARLTFKGVEVKEVETNEVVGTEILVEDDDMTENVNEQITALVSHISADQDADAVKAYFTVDASAYTGFAVDEVVVTNDVNYSVSYETAEELKGFAGTNSTVTFYTTYNGVKLPVATVKIVVDGDINGDGAVDVLDAAYGALVAAEKTELEGCYLLAGDLSGSDRVVEAADYQQIANKVVA